MPSDSAHLVSELEKRVFEKFHYLDEARKLKAEEYERRLNELNHANERNLQRNAEFVGVEKFEGFSKEFTTLVDGFRKEFTAMIDGFRKEFITYKEATNRALVLREGASQGGDKTVKVMVAAFGFLLVILQIINLLKGWSIRSP